MEGINVDQLSHSVLGDMNNRLEVELKGDVIFIHCGMQPPLDEQFRVVVEDLSENTNKKLIVVLETGGGYMEVVERLVSVMRTHYDEVTFIIPNFAYSAGTVLALSGDEILMDYFSVLGPIDPQYQDTNGQFLPGAGYLAKFKELVDDINDPKINSEAQLSYLVNNFDPARLFHIEQSINHGVSLIREWLPKYKFKNWEKTKTTKKNVTDQMKKDRAEEIAKVLGDAEKWHSHGRGIPMNELTGDDIKLEIENFGEKTNLNGLVRNYHGLCTDYYINKSGINGFIHSSLGLRRVL